MRLRPAKSWFALLVVLELFLTGLARADHPAGTLYQVSGYVRDQYSNAVVGILVYGDNFIGDTYPSITDSNGYYLVNYPADGNYRLTVDCASLTARGYGCIGDIGVAQEGDMIYHDFVVPKLDVSLQVTNTTLPHGNVGMEFHAQLGANGGQPPYHWQLATNSPNLPVGLTLDHEGVITGMPIVFSAANLIFEVRDANDGYSSKTLQLVINPRPRLSLPSLGNNRFTMRLAGAPKQNYTLQYATNLMATNWISLLVTNNPDVGTFTVRDTNAVGEMRFYRVLIGP
jgi:hypothetical protein